MPYCFYIISHLKNIWLCTELVAGSWDSELKIWNLNLLRNGEGAAIACYYVVFAPGGGSQVPVTPTYENRVGHNCPYYGL